MNENQVTIRQALYETRNGDPERALAMWREIIERDEHVGPAHHVSGLLCMKLELFPDAEFHFRRAVAAQPENWDYHKDLGMAVEGEQARYAEGEVVRDEGALQVFYFSRPFSVKFSLLHFVY